MLVPTQKMKAREELFVWTEKNLHAKFSELNQKQQSIAATKFYIKEIHNPIGSEISDDELSEAIVDGSNDLGCDLLHRDDGHVLIIQTKFHHSSEGEKAEEISHFQSILERFRNPGLTANAKLRELLSDIDWKTDSFSLIFITFSKMSSNVRSVSEQTPKYPDDLENIEDRCEWAFLEESPDLNEALRSARNLQEGALNKRWDIHAIGPKGKRGKSSIIEVGFGQYRSFVMALDARQITNIYHGLGRDQLFSLNIRNYIGNTKTNTSIIKTGINEPNNFFLYNNGISCLASKVSPHEDHLEVMGLQVINGAQTVKALVQSERQMRLNNNNLWDTNSPTVLVRITEIPTDEIQIENQKVRDNITQFNNTQNVIKDSDFRSNDAVQNNLKLQFGELFRFGKKIAYVPKRTDKPNQNFEVIKMEEYAKSIYAFLYNPVSFSGSSSFLFNTDKDGGYVKVFGDGTALWEKMPEDEFRLRAGIYWLAQEFGVQIRLAREAEQEADARASLERKWLVIHAAKIAFQGCFPDDEWKSQIRKLYKGDWKFDDGTKGSFVSAIFKASIASVKLSYIARKKNDAKFVHRNWMRSKDTPDEISEVLQNLVLPYASHEIASKKLP